MLPVKSNDILTSEGLKSEITPHLPLEPTSQSATKAQMSAILGSHTRGGETLRKALGMVDEEPLPQIFSATAMQRMGGLNPHTGKVEDNSPKKSPTKRKSTNSHINDIVNNCKLGALNMSKKKRIEPTI